METLPVGRLPGAKGTAYTHRCVYRPCRHCYGPRGALGEWTGRLALFSRNGTPAWKETMGTGGWGIRSGMAPRHRRAACFPGTSLWRLSGVPTSHTPATSLPANSALAKPRCCSCSFTVESKHRHRNPPERIRTSSAGNTLSEALLHTCKLRVAWTESIERGYSIPTQTRGEGYQRCCAAGIG